MLEGCIVVKIVSISKSNFKGIVRFPSLNVIFRDITIREMEKLLLSITSERRTIWRPLSKSRTKMENKFQDGKADTKYNCYPPIIIESQTRPPKIYRLSTSEKDHTVTSHVTSFVNVLGELTLQLDGAEKR